MNDKGIELNSMFRIAACLVFSSVIASTARAEGSPSSPSIYYKMGGGEAVGDALNPEAAPQPIGLADDMKLPNSCEIWEHRENLGAYAETIIRDYVETKLDAAGLTNEIITAIDTLPQMVVVATLQRALPGMYDWMNNLNGLIDTQLDVSTNSCRAAIRKMDNGASPIDAWLDIATGQAWKTTLANDYVYDTDATHLNIVAREIPQNARNTSIPWYGGTAGGAPGAPIEVTKGIVAAGYAAASSTTFGGGNTVVTATPTTANVKLVSAAGGTTRPTRVAQLFPDSDDAVEFARAVLGEESITYCGADTCDTTVTPGVGLKPAYQAERAELIAAWDVLLTAYPPGGTTNPTIAEFDGVSSPSNRITKQVYNTLRERSVQDRNVFIYRFVSDVAVENTVEKALAIRQMINSGTMTPEVQAYEITKEKSARMSAVAREVIEEFIWEVSMKERLAANTASLLLESATVLDLQAAGSAPGTGLPNANIEIRNGDVLRRN